MTNEPQSPWYLREFDGGFWHTILSLGAVILFVTALFAVIGASA